MIYTLDASALMAFLLKEKGDLKVKAILKTESKPFIHAINLLEVKYKIKQKHSDKWPEIKKLVDKLPLTVTELTSPKITDYACYLKSKHALSLADSIGLGLAKFMGNIFLTADRRELEVIAKTEKVKIEFLR